jgi:hypothetical protein
LKFDVLLVLHPHTIGAAGVIPVVGRPVAALRMPEPGRRTICIPATGKVALNTIVTSPEPTAGVEPAGKADICICEISLVGVKSNI